MKLYLSSLAIQNPHAYMNLFDTQTPEIVIVANAWGTPTPEESKPYIDMIRRQFKDMGVVATQLDLLDYRGKQDKLKAKLSTYDGVWVTGGNTYYLNWAIHQSGLQNIIHELCEKGFVYGGESAGAVVAGPTLDYFQTVDDPHEAPEVILEGMSLTNIVVVPHANDSQDSAAMKQIAAHLQQNSYEVALLADGQELIINANR